MKILKWLSKTIIFIFFVFLPFSNFSYSTEPVDIWNIEKKKKIDIKSENIDQEKVEDSSVIKIEEKITNIKIKKENDLVNSNSSLIGLYDPEENNLNLDMWTNSDGVAIKDIYHRLEKLNLSKDANEILNIALLTNSYFPKKNISEEEFLDIKSKFLLKRKNLSLIKKFLQNNKELNNNTNLIKYYTDHYLSNSNINNACEIFDDQIILEDYLFKFKVYCLIKDEKKEEAQLLFDLKKEQNFKDAFFEKKFNILMGYEINQQDKISEKNILEFHLSHITSDEFLYTPNENTSKLIWKYLSSSNLLEDLNEIDLEDEKKIKMIEKATNEKNYTEAELFNLYKRFNFSFDQLLNVKDEYKKLPSYESRALIYQRLKLTIDIEEKLFLARLLKESFLNDEIEKAFEKELFNILKEINFEDIPSDYSTFYESNFVSEKIKDKKIKYNNKIIHQSKLLIYFLNQSSIGKIEKDTNDLLKKVKKNKKYIFSTKDIMLLESLKSDGVQISSKYDGIYEANVSIPPDIQVLINNRENGMVLMRLAEIIGEDDLLDLGTENINFIVNVLNQLNLDKLRNQILLKVLPLKV